MTRGGLIIGHVELKAPGAGVDPDGFTGHNLDQWLQLRHLPNLLYTDGIDWILWQDGQQVARATAWTAPGKGIASRQDRGGRSGACARCVLRQRPPCHRRRLRSLPGQRLVSAGSCATRSFIRWRLAESEGLAAVAGDWRSLLFPEATDAEFADAYAQTITFGLIAARAADAGLTAGDSVAERVAQATKALDAEAGLNA